jgi:small subunit ribosomal protein S20
MPNIKSAKKRVKVSARKTESNLKFRGSMKTAIKKVNKTANTSVEDVNDAIKKIDKALKKGIIKKNTAARKKSRLTKKVNKAK